MDARPYEPRDRAACLVVLLSLPAPPELPLFEAWLDHAGCPYFVLEHDGAIVGCGGYSLTPDRTLAELQWGMIAPAFQRQGLGRFLLLYRIREIGKIGTVNLVTVHPPAHAAGFYEKQAFRPTGVPGELIRKLTVCS